MIKFLDFLHLQVIFQMYIKYNYIIINITILHCSIEYILCVYIYIIVNIVLKTVKKKFCLTPSKLKSSQNISPFFPDIINHVN